MATGDVAVLLGHLENRVKTLLNRLTQLAEHLRQILADPVHARPDWPSIVTHFRVSETQLRQFHRDVQPFLQYFVFRPASNPAKPPPPQADIPLMLSTRSYLEMEGEEVQLQAAYWDRAHAGEHMNHGRDIQEKEKGGEGQGGVEKVIEGFNDALERVDVVCDWLSAEFRDKIKSYKSPGLETPAWRDQAATVAEKGFRYLEAVTDGHGTYAPLAR